MQCVLNAVGLTEYAQMQLYRGQSALQMLIGGLRARSMSVIVVGDGRSAAIRRVGSEHGDVRIIDYPSGGVGDFCLRMAEAVSDDIFVYARADAPFIDVACIERMVDIHRTYAAEFTFADGYPSGFAAEVMNSELLTVLPRLARDGERVDIATTLFSIIERDINAFDIETELASVDMRALRIQLHCDTRNNYLLCRAVAEKTDGGAGDILSVIDSQPQLLRQLPMFVAVELTSRHPQTVRHLPQRLLAARSNVDTEEMDVERFRDLMHQVADLSPQAMVYISLWGEIALHSQLESIITVADDFPIQFVCQTSGVGWSGGGEGAVGYRRQTHHMDCRPRQQRPDGVSPSARRGI